jgi:hypothetical protein
VRTKALWIVVAASLVASCRDGSGAPGGVSSGATNSVTRPPPPPAGPEELAVVAPLHAGDDLGGFTVRAVRGVEGGVMRVVLAKGEAVVRLDVALLGEGGPTPPASSGRFAIFYSLRGATPADGERLAKKLAEVIGAHPDVQAPRGMTPFSPKPKPGVAL